MTTLDSLGRFFDCHSPRYRGEFTKAIFIWILRQRRTGWVVLSSGQARGGMAGGMGLHPSFVVGYSTGMQNSLFGGSGRGPIDFDKELNAEQLDVVKNGDGHCVVLAGAGSGKTRTIVHRVAWLLEHGTAPDRILLVTFTNKAAEEMRARINELSGGGASAVWAGTFHSTANRVLRAVAEDIGFTKSFTILDDDDGKALMKATMRELGFAFDGKRFPSPAVVRDLLSYAVNARVSIEQAILKKHPKFEELSADIRRIGDAYDRKKHASNAMDFDDLLVRLYRLLLSDLTFRERFAARFDHILVDEYQDTNPLQAAVIDLICGNNLIVVGDDAQSIYSFRAADVRNILDFPKRHPGSRIFTLVTNYRSTPEILALANDVISRNVDKYDKELLSVKESYLKPAVVPHPSASREAAFIVAKVQERLDAGVKPQDIAVLFRAAFQSQTLEFELARQGIVYDYRGGLKFFDRAHVRDALAFLRIAANYSDESAWLRVLLLQEGIGEVMASRMVAALREEGSLARAILAPMAQRFGARAAKGWNDVQGILEQVQDAGGKPGSVVRAVLDSSYAVYLENEYPNYKDRMEDVQQLANFADGYESAADLLAEITLDPTVAGGGRRNNDKLRQIVLSTIHQAKGLEWDTVFVMHLTNNAFPNRRAALEEGGLEEERRLFYVAVTRAKRQLYLTYPMTTARDAFGMEQPSLFLEEADTHLLDLSASGDGFGGVTARPYGKLLNKSLSSSDDGDGFFEEDTVDIDAPKNPMADIKKRMGGVRKSFLKDV